MEYYFHLILQEDLTTKDIENIIDELKAGNVPKPGPRYIICIIKYHEKARKKPTKIIL